MDNSQKVDSNLEKWRSSHADAGVISKSHCSRQTRQNAQLSLPDARVRRPANLSNPFACILTHMIHKLFISSTTRVDYYTKYITRHCGPNQGGYQPKHSFRLLFFNVYLFLYQFCRRI